MFFFCWRFWECPEILFFILRNSESEFGKWKWKMSHKKELRKVDIFGHSPRGNKPRIKNSRLSETGARAVQKLWTFRENFADFWWRCCRLSDPVKFRQKPKLDSPKKSTKLFVRKSFGLWVAMIHKHVKKYCNNEWIFTVGRFRQKDSQRAPPTVLLILIGLAESTVVIMTKISLRSNYWENTLARHFRDDFLHFSFLTCSILMIIFLFRQILIKHIEVVFLFFA
jgi:hypothetical protein